MKGREALRVLAEASSAQWGMVTTAQVAALGVSRLDLARLADSGQLIRLTHGVYRDTGAPADEFEALRAAWLSTDPRRTAAERLADDERGTVVSGPSAAWLHGIGDLSADRHEFTTPQRRQSQRAELRFRQRELAAQDVTIIDGLPVTGMERTVADLVEDRQDLSLVADVLRDAARKRSLDYRHLDDLLVPLAARRGFRKGDGAALRMRLMELAGIDALSVAKRISRTDLGPLVAAAAWPDFNKLIAAQMPNIDMSKFVTTNVTLPKVDMSKAIVASAMSNLDFSRFITHLVPKIDVSNVITADFLKAVEAAQVAAREADAPNG